MGWLYTYKEPGMPVIDFFRKQFNFQRENGHYGKVLDCAVVKMRTAYVAYEIGDARGNREVIAYVCLLSYTPSYHDNFGYKAVDETMGPNECDCPERILKLLTPTDNEYAKKWREKCWENIRKHKTMPRLKKGMVIEFARPIAFSGGWGERSVFTVVDARRLVFESSGRLFKLRRSTLQNNEWKIVQSA
ncbi:MAG: hypothetical protein K6T65_01515 [Peptococcaceae bacterium]|nr:hypothetical protein [Peptococcaceae bacterium]